MSPLQSSSSRILVGLVIMPALAAAACAQGGAWVPLGGAGASAGTTVTPFVTVHPGDGQPVVVYQTSAFSASIAEKWDGTAWQILGPGFASTATGWYHSSTWRQTASGSNLLVFTRDYGAVDGHLKEYDFMASAWIDHGLATTAGAHDVWVDLDHSNPSSPFHNVPLVAFADRATNPTLPTSSPGYDPNADYGTVKKFVAGSWIPLGPVGFTDGFVKHTTVRVSDGGDVYFAYRDLARGQRATVMKYDPGTDSWNFLGAPGFSPTAAQNLTLDLDQAGVPVVAWLQYGTAVHVWRWNAAAGAWQPQGGPASGSDLAHLSGPAWRMRVPLLHDSANNPVVAYNLFPSPGVVSKLVVRRYDPVQGAWQAIGSAAGVSAGEAHYPTLARDGSDVLYLAYRDEVNGSRLTVLRRAPILPPIAQGTGCTVPPLAPSPLLQGSGPGPIAAQTYAFQVNGAYPSAAARLYAGAPAPAPGAFIGGTCFVQLLPPLLEVATFTTDAAGSATLPFPFPAGTEGVAFALQALVLDGFGGFALTGGLVCTVQ